MQNEFEKLVQNINSNELDTITKLSKIVDFLRPKNGEEVEAQRLETLTLFFNSKVDEAVKICDEVSSFFINLKLSINISSFGMLSRNGFGYELKERFYNKFLPNPPNKGELKYIFATIFRKRDDYTWVAGIQEERLKRLLGALFANSSRIYETKKHLFYELLYALEILSIRIASEEFDESFIRLDKGILERDSAFIALQREVAKFVSNVTAQTADIEEVRLDFKHLEVLINQCRKQVDKFQKKSVDLGISFGATYELEYLKQIINRVEDIIYCIKTFDTSVSGGLFLGFFKEAIRKNATRNSLSEVYKQTSQIIAKSITNNISEHGEHYLADTKKEYFMMFFSSAGAGIIIAIMALFKIKIAQAGLSYGIETILVCLNYSLGFLLIHLVGFTVATKQPAMTASVFASEVEQDESNKANQNKLIELIFKVCRSQFASVAGNVSIALFVAYIISRAVQSGSEAVLSVSEAQGYLAKLEPFAPLFFAAIAGVWLFCAGLISGYFDNRADCLELRERFYHHPLFKRLFGENRRKKVANYLHEHHGAIIGNLCFGVLLGVTPFVGMLLNLPLDIAHVALSSAILGFCATHLGISSVEFIYYLFCVLLIGGVNLIVSFLIALKVSLISRDTSIGNLFLFLKRLFKEMIKRPYELVFPFRRESKIND